MFCDHLQDYLDKKLSSHLARTFELHLVDCERCQSRMLDIMQVTMLEARMAPPTQAVTRRRKPLALAASLVAVAATAVLVMQPNVSEEITEPAAEAPLSLAPERLLQARLSDPELGVHRPYSPMRTSDSAYESVPLQRLSARQQAGDDLGLAALYLVSGNLAEAERVLKASPESVRRDADLAALLLARSRYEAALEHADRALRLSPDDAVALWNRGLALRELGLPLAAGRMFDRVSVLGEPGWSREASDLADELREEPEKRARQLLAIVQAGEALLVQRTNIPVGLIRDQPDLSRLYLYDAIRTAKSSDLVERLRPMAEALEYPNENRPLTSLVDRVSKANFAQRAKLAAKYEAHRSGVHRLDAGEVQAFVRQAQRQGWPDLVVGMLFLADAASHFGMYRQAVRELNDPWFDLQALEVEAGMLGADDDKIAASEFLRDPVAQCDDALRPLRCLNLRNRLAWSEALLLRPDALTEAQTGLTRARQHRLWGLEQAFLKTLLDTSRMAMRESLTYAYYEEIVAHVEFYVRLNAKAGELGKGDTGAMACGELAEARQIRAAAAVDFEFDTDLARAELEPTELCWQQGDVRVAALVLADIARLGGDQEAGARALEMLAQSEHTTTGLADQLTRDFIRGRVLLGQNVELGRQVLRDVIEEARTFELDQHTIQLPAALSYGALIAEESIRERWPEVWDLLASELTTPPPSACALGVSLDLDRLTFVSRGAAGGTLGQVELRTEPVLASTTLRVPEAIVQSFSGCDEIEVFARAPISGTAGLLTSDLAWSYRVGPQRAAAPPSKGEWLVVTDVETHDPNLPRLPPGPPIRGATRVLRGEEATPEAVWRELERGYAFVEIHAHGTSSQDGSASLVLSPGKEGRSMLHVSDVNEHKIAGSPVVILAACDIARVSRHHHVPWGLPPALVRAGASAVIASPEPISDSDARAFYSDVRASIMRGDSPAVALRDARVAWRRDHHGDKAAWVDRVLVFE